MAELEDIKKVISETKLNGDDMPEGVSYGRLPFPFDNIHFYRDLSLRMCFIDKHLLSNDFSTLLDLGCHAGHHCFHYLNKRYIVTGVDNDSNAIRVANLIQDYFIKNNPNFSDYKNCGFHNVDILSSDVPKCDVILYLSTFQWVAKQHGLDKAKEHLKSLSKKCKMLFFETAGSDSKAPLPQADSKEWVENLLEDCGFLVTHYDKLPCTTGSERWIFACLSKK